MHAGDRHKHSISDIRPCHLRVHSLLCRAQLSVLRYPLRADGRIVHAADGMLSGKYIALSLQNNHARATAHTYNNRDSERDRIKKDFSEVQS